MNSLLLLIPTDSAWIQLKDFLRACRADGICHDAQYSNFRMKDGRVYLIDLYEKDEDDTIEPYIKKYLATFKLSKPQMEWVCPWLASSSSSSGQ